MTKAYIEPSKCIRCSPCQAARVCPIRAIFRLADDESSVVDMAVCHGCGDCVAPCPVHAVVLKNG